jgi:protoporphyrinogen oxidase
MARVVVIGAGPMGLAAAYQASVDGHDVDLVEGAGEPGGMAAHFDFGGLSIEKFYHFICKDDRATFQILRDLGIADKLRWVPTTMGFYLQGGLQKWGNPAALLQLKGVSLFTKLRYGVFALVCTRRDRWDALERESARDWLTRWCGKEGYENFWRPLFDYKFYEYSDDISARWIWTRIRRIGRSRRSIFQEELGYLEGGSQTLVDALAEQIRARGSRIRLKCGAERVVVKDGKVTGVETRAGIIAADYVISTVPVQQVPGMVPDLPEEWKARYAAIHNIGICCVIFKLKRKVSPHFWVNITDASQRIPGIVEFSNLRPVDDNIVYVPYYMPITDPRFSMTDGELVDDSFACLTMVNPELTRADLIDARVGRLRYAQPICEAGFASKIPAVETPIEGLQVADTCFYYPEDRGISESVRLGREMARRVTAAVTRAGTRAGAPEASAGMQPGPVPVGREAGVVNG